MLLISTVIFSQEKADIIALFSDANSIVWHKTFLGLIDELHPCKLNIAFDGYNCKGYLSFDSSKERMLLTGSIEDGKIEMVEKHNGLPTSYINGEIKGEELLLSIEPIGSETASVGLFRTNSDLFVKGESSSSYTPFVEESMIFPSHANAGFNDFIKECTNDWQKEIRLKAKKSTTRAGVKSIIHHEVLFQNEHFINGKLLFENSWSKERKEINFCYDLQNDKNLKFSEVFTKEKQLRAVLKEKFLQAGMNEGKFKHEGYREWILKQKIEAFSLEETGVRFYTKEDLIYGSHEVYLDYSSLLSFLRKNISNKIKSQ